MAFSKTLVQLLPSAWITRCLAAGTLLAATPATAQQLTPYVDPMIGTGGHGHVFLGANVPFGAVQLGPQNIFKGWDWCSGYHYSDSLSRASPTHT
jgi:putative alpha-1,2-mannosidase